MFVIGIEVGDSGMSVGIVIFCVNYYRIIRDVRDYLVRKFF